MKIKDCLDFIKDKRFSLNTVYKQVRNVNKQGGKEHEKNI